MKTFVFLLALVLFQVTHAATFLDGLVAYGAGDYKVAMKEWKPLAEQGLEMAQYQVGLLYIKGEGVKQNYGEAFKWFHKAAVQGYSKAQLILGMMYHEGKSVPQDYVQAHAWFNLSGSGGEDFGADQRDILAQRMTPEQIAEAQALAKEWAVKYNLQ